MPATALTVIHKHLRREMFDFSMRLFRAGVHDIDNIKLAFDELAALLHAHATQEEAKLEPLLKQRDPTAAATLLSDHHRLDGELDRLSAIARELDADSPSCVEVLLQLHLDWNRYLSAYLAHLDAEERSLFECVAERLPISTIADSALAQGEEGKKFLDRLWSVTTPTERIAIERAHESSSSCVETVAA